MFSYTFASVDSKRTCIAQKLCKIGANVDAALRGEENACETLTARMEIKKRQQAAALPEETFTCRIVYLRDNNDAREILGGGPITGVFVSPRKSDSLTAGLPALYTEEL